VVVPHATALPPLVTSCCEWCSEAHSGASPVREAGFNKRAGQLQHCCAHATSMQHLHELFCYSHEQRHCHRPMQSANPESGIKNSQATKWASASEWVGQKTSYIDQGYHQWQALATNRAATCNCMPENCKATQTTVSANAQEAISGHRK
jgi:hypothetical protein